MRLIEKLVSVITPDNCIVCSEEGSLLCEACGQAEVPRLSSACFRCGAITSDFSTCQKCRRTFPLSHVWSVARYDGWPKQLIHELKFNASRSAARPIADLCRDILPIMDGYIVTHLPTSSQHIRERGFDQTARIAKHLSRQNLPYSPLLRRIKKIHQIGSSQAARQKQLVGAFIAINKYLIKDAKILLVDDVATTGSSLAEAARTLRKAGAKEVSAVVFART